MSETPDAIERMFGPRPASPAVANVTRVDMRAFVNEARGTEGFVLEHAIEGVGFGEFVFVYDRATNSYRVDNECMGRPWLERVLLAFLAKCELDDPMPSEGRTVSETTRCPGFQDITSDGRFAKHKALHVDGVMQATENGLRSVCWGCGAPITRKHSKTPWWCAVEPNDTNASEAV